MPFLILGAGALGGFFGSRLIKAGADATFLVRGARAAQIERDGLIVKDQDGDLFRSPAKTVRPGQVESSYDVVILCCKAYDLESAMSAIAPAVGERSVVLPLLNGIRHVDVLKGRFGEQAVLGGLTVINAALLVDGTIQQSQLRINITAIGELNGRTSSRCNAIKAALDQAGIAVNVLDNIVSAMWQKFFGFACNAAIASLTRSRAGAIARSGAARSFISAVIDECTKIIAAEGYPPPPDIASMVRGAFLQPDSSYGPSLLIDMENGRPTEGDHTIGDLVNRAAQSGINAPIFSAALCNLQVYEINRSRKQSMAK